MLHLSWDKRSDRQILTMLLKNNNVCIGTSDTVWGLYAPVTPAGFAALNVIKKRTEKPYLLLIQSLCTAKLWIKESDFKKLQKITDGFWPGPLTVIVKARESVPVYITGPGHTVALRVPDHAGIQEVLKEIKALFSTSANCTNEPVAQRQEDINPLLLQAAAALITDTYDISRNLSSTIIDCTTDTIKVVRQGTLTDPDWVHER